MKIRYTLLFIATTYFNCDVCEGQTYISPHIGSSLIKTDWERTAIGIPVDNEYSVKLTFAVAIEHSLSKDYSLLLKTAFYSRTIEMYDEGINPTIETRFRVWDSDISLTRRFGKILIGGGFKHQLLHRFYITDIAYGEREAEFSSGGLGFNLNMRYEHDSIGASVMFSQVYNYNGEDGYVAFTTAKIFEIMAYYKFQINKKSRKKNHVKIGGNHN